MQKVGAKLTRNDRNARANSRVAPDFRRKPHGNRREFGKECIMRSGYSDLNWFLRAARVVPVIAGAALLGGMIGGFAMFAIDSALTWDSAPQSRPDAHSDNATSAVNPQPNKSVRIVGGAIPDPSAGMSGPPPAQPPQSQPQRTSAPAQSQTQISPQLLTAKPLGPASHLQPQTAPAVSSSASTPGQPQNQTANQPPIQTTVEKPVQTQKLPASQDQTRWPDALSRTHQNAANGANPPSAQQPTATAPAAAQSSEAAANKNKEADRKDTSNERAANTDEGDTKTSRQSRHNRRHAATATNGSGNASQNNGAAASSRRQQDARGYDRLYDSYGDRRDRNAQDSYGNTRESYGSRRGQSYRVYRDDQDDAARFDQSRSDQRQYGRDTRSRGRSRVIVRDQDESDRSQAFESRPRPEPFWGGGFFGRGYDD
jgi:hypothetical protein